MRNEFEVLLFYKFVEIDEPEQFARDHLELCHSMGLKGRIIVAHEGINGTVSGTLEAAEKYRLAVLTDPRFADMEFKTSPHHEHAFKRLSVKARAEIITFGAKVDLEAAFGTHLTPSEFKEKMEDENVLILDGRNDYEYDLGHFQNAVRPPVETFKEIRPWLEEVLGEDQGREILTYCTGGIRCEKLVAYLYAQGFKNVRQLHGGIVSYGADEATAGALFHGQCFVFDERIAVEINRTEDRRIVGRCSQCEAPCERYVNCANVACNLLYLSCEACEEVNQRCCCDLCMAASRKRQSGQKLRQV